MCGCVGGERVWWGLGGIGGRWWGFGCVVTYVCLISFYFFNGVVEIASLYFSKSRYCLHPQEKIVRCLKLFPLTWKGKV